MGSSWSERKCDVYSRWWTTTHHQTVSREILVLVFCLIVFLPCAYSEEQHSLQRSRDDDSATIRFAEIDVSFIDPDNKKKMKVLHYQGKYGTKSIIDHVSGVVMHTKSKVRPDSKSSATNHSGCSEYVNKKFPKGPWIALVERGDCRFTKKIKIATKVHNASAIVIYNRDDKDLFKKMEHEDTASISVFLKRQDGVELVNLLSRGTKVDMTIGPGEQVSANMPNSISKTSVLFVSVSFIVLMVVSLAWLVFYYIQRFRYSHAKERLARLLACAAKKAIAKIPQKTIKAGDKELEGDFDQCAVCIEHYKPHDVIRILPCRHIFHKSCIDPWLLDQRSCPMCKLDILRAYGMQVSGSQESFHRDPESGPARQTISEDADVRFSVVEDNRAEVLLVPHTTWLHVHVGDDDDGERAGHELDDDEEAGIRQAPAPSQHSPGADTDDITVLLPSSPAMGCSHNVSRAQKKDKEDSLNAETKALISNGMEVKHQLSADEDEDEDIEARQGEGQAFSFGGHSVSTEGPEDEQGDPSCIADAASSWTGSSSSSHGLGLCKEINVNVEVNHETSA